MPASTEFKKAFTPIRLEESFQIISDSSNAVGNDRITIRKFKSISSQEYETIIRKVARGTYRFTTYRQLLLSKGANEKPRVLCIPTVRDRVVLKALSSVIDEAFGKTCRTQLPQDVISSLVSAIQSGHYSAFLKVDMQQFYDNIDHEQLMKTLRAKIRKPEILQLIQNAITTPSSQFGHKSTQMKKKGVPQGLCISNSLANVAASKLDRVITRKIPDALYYRYVDDIIILCQTEKLPLVKQVVQAESERYKFVIKEKKTKEGSLENDSFDYLGFVFDGHKITVRQASKQKIEQSLERQMREVASHNGDPSGSPFKRSCDQLNRRITGCKITADGNTFQRYGWLFYYSKINDISYLAQLDALVKKYALRFGVNLPPDTPSFKKAYLTV